MAPKKRKVEAPGDGFDFSARAHQEAPGPELLPGCGGHHRQPMVREVQGGVPASQRHRRGVQEDLQRQWELGPLGGSEATPPDDH